MSENLKFVITDQVKNLGVQGCYITITGLKNKKFVPEFEVVRQKEINQILDNLTEDSISNDHVLQGFWELHKAVNRESKKNTSSPENMLNLLLKYKTLPSINLVVDIYNLISLKTKLALGAHDISQIDGSVSLRLTDGSERFHPLGYSKAKIIGTGEYGYIDDSNEILCRMEVRQSEKTKVTESTTDCFYIIQGNESIDIEYIKTAANDLAELTLRFCGGELKWL